MECGERIREAEQARGLLVLLLLVLAILKEFTVLVDLDLVQLGVGDRLGPEGGGVVDPVVVLGEQRDVEQRRILLHDGELDLARLEALGEDLHRVDAGQEDPPEFAVLCRLETDIPSFNLQKKREHVLGKEQQTYH